MTEPQYIPEPSSSLKVDLAVNDRTMPLRAASQVSPEEISAAPTGDETPSGIADCDCHKRLADELTERFKSNVPAASAHRVELQGYCFGVIGNTMVYRPFMAYKASADYPLKKGGTKWKSQTGNMLFSFCPFCGHKFNTGEAA